MELDSKLSWNRHVLKKVKTAKFKLMHVRHAIGKLTEPSPKITWGWAYSSTIRPVLTYSCHVWSRAITDKSIASSLVRVNRLALMLMGNFRTKTPTAGLEVISYIPPLHLVIESEAAMKFRQIQGHLSFTDSKLKTTTLSKRGTDFCVGGIFQSWGWRKRRRAKSQPLWYGIAVSP